MSRGKAVAQMFYVFGSAADERVKAWSETVGPFTRCDACFELTCKYVAVNANRVPQPSQFIALYRDTEEREHHKHIGATSRQLEVGTEETFWHQEAPKVIAEFVEGDLMLSAFIAAEMWWADVPDNITMLRDEMEQHGKVWVVGMQTFLAANGGLTPTLTARAFARARYKATYGVMAVPESLLDITKEVTPTT